MRTPLLICDLDNIVTNLMDPWLAWYNDRWKDDLTLARFKHYNIMRWVKPECKEEELMEFFSDLDRYRNLSPLEGAVEGLREVHNLGVEIVISTAVVGECAGPKFSWCAKYLPFVPQKNIQVGYRKDLLGPADFFIDDAPGHLKRHREKWPETNLLTIAYPYNEDLVDFVDIHARCYQNTHAAWETMVKAIEHRT